MTTEEKTSRRRRGRKLLRVLLGVVLIFVGLLAALPFWFPWVLRSALNRYGIQHADVQRISYQRFAVTEVRAALGNSKFEAQQIEAFAPTAWLGRLVAGKQEAPSFLVVTNWKLAIEQKPKAADAPRSSPEEVHREINDALGHLKRWLPHALLKNGVVDVRGREFRIPQATWSHGEFHAQISAPRKPFAKGERSTTVAIHVSQTGAPPLLNLSFTTPESNFYGGLTFAGVPSGFTAQGNAIAHENPIRVSAEFTRDDWLPQTASVRAPTLRISAGQLNLEGYEELMGAFHVEMRDEQFEATLNAHASPAESSSRDLPPVHVTLRATGNTNRIQLHELHVSLPWMAAQLSRDVVLGFDGTLLSDPASFGVTADLTKQPWVPASGTLQGQVLLTPSNSGYPDAELKIAATNLQGFRLAVEQAEFDARFTWPWLNVAPTTELRLASNATARFQGQVNVKSRAITNAQIQFSGPLPQHLLPARYSHEDVSALVHLSGPLDHLTHTGRVEVLRMLAPRLAPLDLRASWRGTNFASQFAAALSVSNAAVQLSGRFAKAPDRAWRATLTELVLVRRGQVELGLREPATLELELPKRDNTATNILARLDNFHWEGPTNNAIVLTAATRWPIQGNFQAQIRNISSELWSDFLRVAPPRVALRELRTSGNWSNGPVHLTLVSDLALTARDQSTIGAQVQLRSDAAGLGIEQLNVTRASRPLLAGAGRIPITLMPAAAPTLVQLHAEESVAFEATTRPDAPFWDEIAARTGVHLRDPNVVLRLSGSLTAPEGSLALRATSLEWRRTNAPVALPPLENLQANVAFNRDRLVLDHFALRLAGQPIRARGEVPLGTNYSSWKTFFQWPEATGRLVMTNAQIQPFAAMFPKMLASEGHVSIDITAQPENRWSGTIEINGAALRPVMPLGPVREINARLAFHERAIQIDAFRGTVGGEPVLVTGNIDLRPERWRGDLPQFDLRVAGSRVPLVRRSDVVLRSDLNLTLSNATNDIPRISGTVELRDGFYLSDLADLMPRGPATPRRRPPYFSIEEPPLANWQLDVQVRGDEFLKIRSPVFRGAVSARIKLEGTLKEPLPLGEVSIPSGAIQFPFANLDVQQGIVSLTSARPHQPEVFVIARSKAYGYDVTLEVTGTADAPKIEFSSTPSLTSEQIVLMLTAGQVPRNDFAISNQQKMTRLGLLVGKSFVSKFAGDEAGAERLTIRSGENISERGKPTYSVEYKLTDRWSLVAEYDRFSELNAGVKWRVFSR